MKLVRGLAPTVALLAGLGLASPPQAHADRIISPYPGNDVRTVLGTFDWFGVKIVGVCFEAPTGQSYGIWLSRDQFTEDHTLDLGQYNDIVHIMPPGTSTSACGATFTAPEQGNHDLTIFLHGGHDQFHGGSGGTIKIDAGSGNDRIVIYASNVQAWGTAGDDKIWNHLSYATGNYLRGGEGNDCITPRNYDFVDCGGGSGDASTRSWDTGCEKTVSYCSW